MSHRVFSLLVFLLAVFPALAQDKGARLLSLEDCIELALENNLGLKVARYGPLFASNNLAEAYAGYDPAFSLSGEHSFSRRGGGLDSDQRIIPPSESDADRFSTSLGGLLPWGMNYELSGNVQNSSGERGFFDTNDLVLFQTFENSQGSIQGRISQPLLKNSWIDGTRLGIALSKRDLAISKEIYRSSIINLVTDVENSYYGLVAARENVKVQEDALLLAQKLLEENRKRVEVGAMAPLDQQEAEAEVAAREADLLDAQQQLAISENGFKRLLTDDYLMWNEIEVKPSEELTAPVQLFDLQDSWSKALAMRPEIVQAWQEFEQAGLRLKFSKNQLFPQLDAFASYGHFGSDVEFSGVFSQLNDGHQPFWSAGAVLTFPLSNKGARARHRNARAEIEQKILSVKNLEQSVMSGVDNQVKIAEVSYRRVGATRVARVFREAALNAEEERLANGKSTSFLVLQRQRDLTAARSAEIGALVAYNQALANLAQAEGSTLQRRKIDFEEE